MRDRENTAQFAVEFTHWWFLARRAFIAAVFPLPQRSHQPHTMILDIGAGTGGMEPFLASYGKVIGIEPNAHARSLAKKRQIALRAGSATSTGVRSNSVDIVCLFDVLYHKGVNNNKAFSEAYRVLRDGGYLLITDCAMPFLMGSNDAAVSGKQRFRLQDVGTHIENAGFSIQKKSYTFFVLFPFIATYRLLRNFLSRFVPLVSSDVGPVGNMSNVVFKHICMIEAALLRYVSFPWGSSLIVVARKV